MIIYIYLVVFHHCVKSKMAAGGHFEKQIWSLFFSMPNATIFFAFEQFFLGGTNVWIFFFFLRHFVSYVYCRLK